MFSPLRRMAGCAALTAAALVAVAVSGPALADDDGGDASAAVPYPDGINCFWIPSPRGFTVIDSRHLVIEGSGRNYYLATLYGNCFDLRTTFAIRLDRRGSQLCGPGDAIITGEDRCPIRFLEEVEDREAADIRVADRKAAAREAREEAKERQENRSGDSQ